MKWYLWFVFVIIAWLIAFLAERISRRYATESSQLKSDVSFVVILSTLLSMEVGVAASLFVTDQAGQVFAAVAATSFVLALTAGINLWQGKSFI